MDNKYLNEVLDRLENYQKMMRQIELLQYEIQYASHVTPTEMIEVMTFQKQGADNAGANAYPKSVPEIAMSYQRAAAQLNGESVEELISKYADLCHEQDRLSHYIGFLDGRQRDVIRRYSSPGAKLRTAWARRQEPCSGSDNRLWRNSQICTLSLTVFFGGRKTKRETSFKIMPPRYLRRHCIVRRAVVQ